MYSLVECPNCSFVSTNPLPSEDELKKCYINSYWQTAGGLADLLFKFRMRGVLKNIKKMAPKNAVVLDWGAGDGSFLKLLKRSGFECFGIDFYSKTPDNNRIIDSSIEDAGFSEEYFDGIICFHVLEHLYCPSESLKTALKLLKPNGFLLIEVPNISSFGFKVFKEKWQPLEVPVHLNHFSLKSLKKIFENEKNARIIKVNYFSPRVSASALVLSLFPFFSPQKIREKYNGKYPLFLMIIYLFLQILVSPFALLGALFKKGEIIRIVVKKKNSV
jgi:SAM-dependent methyltransferase